MAPEVVNGLYTIHCDLWSLGIVIFLLLFGFSPFSAPTVVETYNLITKHGICPSQPTEGFRNSFPPNVAEMCSPEAVDLITKLLQSDPIRRLSAAEVLDHPWISGRAPKLHMINSKVIKTLQNLNKTTKLQKTLLEFMVDNLSDDGLLELKNAFRGACAKLDRADGLLTLTELIETLEGSDEEAEQRGEGETKADGVRITSDGSPALQREMRKKSSFSAESGGPTGQPVPDSSRDSS